MIEDIIDDVDIFLEKMLVPVKRQEIEVKEPEEYADDLKVKILESKGYPVFKHLWAWRSRKYYADRAVMPGIDDTIYMPEEMLQAAVAYEHPSLVQATIHQRLQSASIKNTKFIPRFGISKSPMFNALHHGLVMHLMQCKYPYNLQPAADFIQSLDDISRLKDSDSQGMIPTMQLRDKLGFYGHLFAESVITYISFSHMRDLAMEPSTGNKFKLKELPTDRDFQKVLRKGQHESEHCFKLTYHELANPELYIRRIT